MKDKHDQEEFYCPKLGHHLTFKYCRTENFGLPCSRLMKCCSHKIPVQSYLYTHYSEDDIKQIFQVPGTKINSILEVVQKVINKNN